MAVSQPIRASGRAETGSAAKDTTPATTAQAISTPVADSLPPRAAATVPTPSSSAKPSGSANGAASPRRFWRSVMSLPVDPRSGQNQLILMHP